VTDEVHFQKQPSLNSTPESGRSTCVKEVHSEKQYWQIFFRDFVSVNDVNATQKRS
jgi:hypothetical protein